MPSTPKLYGLTQAELARLQRAIRYIEDNASMYKAQRRVRGNVASGGHGMRHAYCKTNADAGFSIQCYLDTNLTGEEITVYCNTFEATALSGCVPLLTIGRVIPVYKIGEYWFCAWWFSGTEECGDDE